MLSEEEGNIWQKMWKREFKEKYRDMLKTQKVPNSYRVTTFMKTSFVLSQEKMLMISKFGGAVKETNCTRFESSEQKMHEQLSEKIISSDKLVGEYQKIKRDQSFASISKVQL